MSHAVAMQQALLHSRLVKRYGRLHLYHQLLDDRDLPVASRLYEYSERSRLYPVPRDLLL